MSASIEGSFGVAEAETDKGPRQGHPHVLLLPSEEFLPPDSHLAGIFQYHQASALRVAGLRVGVISIRQAHSVPMIVRAAVLRAFGRKPGNALDGLSFRAMGRLLIDKLWHQRRFLTIEEISGFPVVRIEGFYYLPPSPRTNHIGWIRAGVVAFDEYCRRFGPPDVIHAHNSDPAGLLAHRLSRQTGIPFVITEHSTFFGRGMVPQSLYPALGRAFTAASTVAVVSPALAGVLAHELGVDASPFRWIPNVIDAAVVVAPLSPRGEDPDTFIFLAIGNLIPVKDHALLLRAFQRAFGECNDVTLRIGGDGELLEELQELVQRLQITSQVRFLGRLSRSAVIDELDVCDSFVLPSRYETFGVVLIEAMARGKTVVSTACGAPEAFIGPEDGILVPTGDVAALADAMVKIRRDRARYDPGEIRNRAILRFGPQRIAEQLENMYSEAIAARA